MIKGLPFKEIVGTLVFENLTLPIDEMVWASNIETRQEVSIPTGNLIHAFKLGNILLVSPELYKQLKKI